MDGEENIGRRILAKAAIDLDGDVKRHKWAALILCLYSSEREERLERRRTTSGVLRRCDLLHPREEITAWERLRQRGTNSAFLRTMGVTHRSFRWLLDRFGPVYDTTVLARGDVNPRGSPRLGRRSLDAAGALGLVLHYMCTCGDDGVLQVVFGTVPAVTSRVLETGLALLLSVLATERLARITWPDADKMEAFSAMIEGKYSLLSGAFGFVDGLRLPIQVPGDPDLENAYYNGWVSQHNIGNIFCFAADGTIMHARLNAPGSFHDSRNSHSLYEALTDPLKTPDPFFICGDSAFPRMPGVLSNKIRVPLKEKTRLPADEDELVRVVMFDQQLVAARQAAEWGMHSLQATYEILRVPLTADVSKRFRILLLVCRLHQVRVRLDGIGQIQTVFATDYGRDHIFRSSFGEIRHNSRVRQYYRADGSPV